MIKVNGVENTKDIMYGPLCFPRGDDFLAFYAVPVCDMDECDKLLPFPKNTNHYFTAADGKTGRFRMFRLEGNRSGILAAAVGLHSPSDAGTF